ncbi:MAG: alpha-ketoglutarate-dependent dioxygenase AlkB [Anderseniella sp.]
MQIDGLTLFHGFYDEAVQHHLVEVLRKHITDNPLYTPVMPRTGKPMSVRMTNVGLLGWVADRQGYRYQPFHPVTGKPWSQIPAILEELWQKVSCYQYPPEACLVNFYAAGARMGLHQDADEHDFNAPVVSVSLGDTAVFRIGGVNRTDPTSSFKLRSGDVMVMGGAARMRFHGIDRIIAGSSTLLKAGGRLNLTLRRVTVPTEENNQPLATPTSAGRNIR